MHRDIFKVIGNTRKIAFLHLYTSTIFKIVYILNPFSLVSAEISGAEADSMRDSLHQARRRK